MKERILTIALFMALGAFTFNSYAADNVTSPAVTQSEGEHPYDMMIFPNPAKEILYVEYDLPASMDVEYYFTDLQGNIIFRGYTDYTSKGKNVLKIDIKEFPAQTLFLTMVLDNKYFVTKRVIKE